MLPLSDHFTHQG